MKPHSHRFLFLLFLFLLTGIADLSYAQIWTRSYDLGGDATPTCMRKLPDGGFIVSGYSSYGSNYKTYAWLARLQANGDTVWTRSFKSDSCCSHIMSVIALPSEEILACGGLYNSHKNGFDKEAAWFVRVSKNGEIIAMRQYRTNYHTNIFDIVLTPMGDIFAIGGRNQAGALPSDQPVRNFVMKLTLSADTVWMKQILGYGFIPQKIDLTMNGNLVISGIYNQVYPIARLHMDETYLSVSTKILDSTGKTLYSFEGNKILFPTFRPNNCKIECAGALVRKSGSILIYGLTDEKFKMDICLGWITSSDQNLNKFEWSFSEGSGYFTQIHDAVEVDNGFVFVGHSYLLGHSDRIWFGKIGYDGKLVWERFIPTNNDKTAIRVLQTSDNGLLLLCKKSNEVEFMKFDLLGTVNTAKQ